MAGVADGEVENTRSHPVLCQECEHDDGSDSVTLPKTMSSTIGEMDTSSGTELRQRKLKSQVDEIGASFGPELSYHLADVKNEEHKTGVDLTETNSLKTTYSASIAKDSRKQCECFSGNAKDGLTGAKSEHPDALQCKHCLTKLNLDKSRTAFHSDCNPDSGEKAKHFTFTEPETVTASDLKQENDSKSNETKSRRDGELKVPGIWEYFCSELTRGYVLEHDEAKFAQKRQRVYTVIRIPKEVEKFMLYGFFQCTDAFLFLFTFLPLRVVMAVLKLCSHVFFCFRKRTGRILEPAQTCDLLKVFILVVCSVAMNYVDTSMMYHIVRGQTIIKLYIFFNMLDVADKLFSSFGQDILDALFWTATEPRGRKREHLGLLLHVALAVLYVILHSFLVLFQATTLNVAFNSHNKSLLTIMMSNNFVELKGSVFKKFEKNNLFQMSCSDVRERFHLLMLMFCVCVRNLTEFSWNLDHLNLLIPDMVMVMIAELLVDWVKHAFITKFNEISSDVYMEYTISIAYDMASSRQKNAFSDHSDLVSRRMGFIPLPLAVILVRVMYQSLHIRGSMAVILIVLCYLCLTTFKILNSIVLLGVACDLINNNKSHASSTSTSSKTAASHTPSKSAPTTPSPTAVRPVLKKSQSTSRLNVTFGDIIGEDNEPIIQREDSFSNKVLLSNSTVNLTTVTLNEEFVKDSGIRKSPDHTVNEGKPGRVQKPLSEIDRYTMCSNRII